MARILYVFRTEFTHALGRIKPFDGLSDQFIPKIQIEKLRRPCIQCVNVVLAFAPSETTEIAPFGKFRRRSTTMLKRHLKPCRLFVNEVIDIELAYHPDFTERAYVDDVFTERANHHSHAHSQSITQASSASSSARANAKGKHAQSSQAKLSKKLAQHASRGSIFSVEDLSRELALWYVVELAELVQEYYAMKLSLLGDQEELERLHIECCKEKRNIVFNERRWNMDDIEKVPYGVAHSPVAGLLEESHSPVAFACRSSTESDITCCTRTWRAPSVCPSSARRPLPTPMCPRQTSRRRTSSTSRRTRMDPHTDTDIRTQACYMNSSAFFRYTVKL